MTTIMTEETENKREYSRVDTCIPLEYNLVRYEHKETMRARVAGQSVLAEFKNLPNPDDQLIAQWLQSINTKLNEIIRLMTLHHDGFNCLNMAKVNISGGGMSLNTGKSFVVGDILEIKVMLGIQMPVALFLYGEVIDTGIFHSEYDTSVEFINMDDFIRDEIIRFVFETEREILREKRR
ncbi:MAG: PilZ domain-containing protein [Smithella sp.]|nr:PilZ domain-containing protein [Smithella sp.]